MDISKRDLFAAVAFHAILSKKQSMSEDGRFGKKTSNDEMTELIDRIVETSYSCADKMIEHGEGG